MLSLFKTKLAARGFSLVEMTVVIAIFLIITGIIIANYPQFRDQSALELLAQEIAVNIRTAQVFGTGARVESGGPDAAKPYGVHFDGANLNNFTTFIDNNASGFFDDGDTVVEDYVLQGANINKLFINGNLSEPQSGDFDITYLRPNPEAKIVKGGDINNNPTELLVEIKGRRGERCKQIRISANGQIAVIPGFTCINENT